jgi:PHD/YefM family antitoxin component YafN of YafNO toxin-antitoxin module
MISLKDDIESLTRFKRNTPGFLKQLRRTGRPLVLTVNGKAELIVQDAASYQELLEAVERLQTIEAIREGLKEMKAGKGKPAEKVLEEVRRKFRIPRDE